jgi:hypothetical protein
MTKGKGICRTSCSVALDTDRYVLVQRLAKVLPVKHESAYYNFSLGVRRALDLLTLEQLEAACIANEADIAKEAARREAICRESLARIARKWGSHGQT